MTSIFTSSFLKTAIAVSLTICAAGPAIAQSSLGSFRSGLNQGNSNINLNGSHARVSALVSRPGNSQDFIASGTSGAVTWQLQRNSVYTYDSQGRLTQRLYTTPASGQNIEREIYVYDAKGNEIEARFEQWLNGAWSIMGAYKTLITYSATGKKTESIFQSWNNNLWQNEEREQIAYDPNDLVTTITYSEFNGSNWDFIDRMVLSNVGGIGSSLVIQEFDGAIWEDTYRAQNVTWRVLYEIPSAYVMQYYDLNAWVNEEKYTAVYDANGGSVGIYEEWNTNTNLWEKTSRETETFDTNKNYNGWKDEDWNSVSSTWDYNGEDREVLTYSGIDITQRIFQDSWNAGNILEDRRKEVYSNFQTFNISGVKNALPELTVNVYPNPAQETLTISFPENVSGFEAIVSDVTGKICLNRTFKTGEVSQLNIEALPKGIYLLQLQTEAGSTVKRIVKQ